MALHLLVLTTVQQSTAHASQYTSKRPVSLQGREGLAWEARVLTLWLGNPLLLCSMMFPGSAHV